MQTGENDQAMRRILDMTRLISIAVLALHFYMECYGAFAEWHLVAPLSDRILSNIVRTIVYLFHERKHLIGFNIGIVLFQRFIQLHKKRWVGLEIRAGHFLDLLIFLCTSVFIFRLIFQQIAKYNHVFSTQYISID
jgi:hypothetical protein